jgi:LuxR family quorum-sensing system transcriptional regulator CciR
VSTLDLLEEFAKRTDACTTLGELVPLLGDACREIGFDYFALTFCDNLRQTAPRFAHLDNYPPVYAEVFVGQRLWCFDPILHAAQRRIGGFEWKNVGDILALRSGQAELLARAAGEGLRDGYTIPANVPGEPCGAVSFAASREHRLTDERRMSADWIARTAFEASRRLRGLSAGPSRVPHLNNREVQCLRRLACGESDKEVARALGISPETVRQYVKMARSSYAARTRAELVALALRDGQIAFEAWPTH